MQPFTIYGENWKCRWFPTEFDSVGHRIFWTGLREWESETAPEILRQIQKSKCFFDIGANCGIYSVIGSILNPDARIVAIEPVPKIFRALERNIAGNHLEKRVKPLNFALGSQNGVVPFHESEDSTMGSLSTSGYGGKSGTIIQVECRTLDALVKTLDLAPDFMKIDVEGFEHAVLEGAQHILSTHRPRIVIEANPGDACHLVSDILQGHRYEFHNITDKGLVQHPTLFGVDAFRNWLCLPTA